MRKMLVLLPTGMSGAIGNDQQCNKRISVAFSGNVGGTGSGSWRLGVIRGADRDPKRNGRGE
jgi:hypothetical protein